MNPQLLALITAIAWGVGGFFEKRGLHAGNLSPQVGITIRTAVALIFLGIAWVFVLATGLLALSLHSPAAGLWFLFLIWLTVVWFLTSSARAEGSNSMYDTLRERFQLRQEQGSPSLAMA